MLSGYKILDADSHVIEPPRMWARYLDPAFRGFAPSDDLKIGGREITRPLSPRLVAEGNRQMKQSQAHSYFHGFDVESHVKAMVSTGVDVGFVYPTYGLWLWAIDDMPAEVAGAFTRAYNRWLYEEYCSYDPSRLRGVGAVNLHAPAGLVEEAHAVAAYGGKAVFVRPNPVKGRLLGDPAYEPFWAACEELGLAVCLHEGTHSRLPTVGSDRFESRFAQHACSHPMEHMMAFLALLESGVLERHPRLRLAFLEAGCGWLPYWLWRLDEEFRNLAWEVGEHVRLAPSEYFRRQCFVAVDPSEPGLAHLVRQIGADNVVFGSDYPHMDHQPDALEKLVALEGELTREVMQKILWDNPCRLYGMT